ncbi:uncharacterized protein [Montipora foliosa]|uniref:uncharacterized protein isoform X2 n=1 Tax=Montipora foliosa TaxID=591990 RepID=UPI0035F17E3D
MESKLLVSLLLFGLLSSALAKGGGGRGGDHGKHDGRHDGRHDDRHDGRHHDHDHDEHDKPKKCPPPITWPQLNMICEVSKDCRTFECSAMVQGEKAILKLEIDTSSGPMSANVSLTVPSRKFHWSHTFMNGQKLQVKGFPLQIQDYDVVHMYFMLKMYEMDEDTVFKLEVYLKDPVTSGETSNTLLKGKLPPSDEDKHRWGRCHKFAAWFKRQSGAVKASIILSAVFVIAMLLIGIVYCCKKRRGVKNVKVQPPSYAQATSTQTKVPLEPLVNEE